MQNIQTVFKKDKVPKTIDIEGVAIKVKSVTPWFSIFYSKAPENQDWVEVRQIECPVCHKSLWLNGLISHLAHRTRGSDIGHAELYLKIMSGRGDIQQAKAYDNIRRWTENHRKGLAMLEQIAKSG